MTTQNPKTEFRSINRGFNSTFSRGRLTLGLVSPIEAYPNSALPSMTQQTEQVRLAEELGFAAIWLRDIPFNVPTFGDVGQMYDPFVYLGFLAAQTSDIALGVASIILPLRHPAHVAKASASADVLSNGRVILGVASGDRPDEYPALNIDFSKRSEKFRNSFEYIKNINEPKPVFDNDYGTVNGGIDMLPKPLAGEIPMLITGSSRQSDQWIQNNGDGWMLYPRDAAVQKQIIESWRSEVKRSTPITKPVMQSLYIDLVADSGFEPQPIHLGYKLGADHLIRHLASLESAGVNHVALNLRFNQADVTETLYRISKEVIPEFTTRGAKSE